jgi:hypothetical protein
MGEWVSMKGKREISEGFANVCVLSELKSRRYSARCEAVKLFGRHVLICFFASEPSHPWV